MFLLTKPSHHKKPYQGYYLKPVFKQYCYIELTIIQKLKINTIHRSSILKSISVADNPLNFYTVLETTYFIGILENLISN